MGCCNDDKPCHSEPRAKRSVPWFALTIGVLLLLVIINWQA
ncbi:hypothetical protein ACPV4B_11210 [Vibrio parahaemolyticus]